MAMTTTDRPPSATVASKGRVRERRDSRVRAAVVVARGDDIAGGAADPWRWSGGRCTHPCAARRRARRAPRRLERATGPPRDHDHARRRPTCHRCRVRAVRGQGTVVRDRTRHHRRRRRRCCADRGRHGRAAAASATLDPSPGHRPRRRARWSASSTSPPGDHGGEGAPGRPRPGSRRCRVDRRGCRALHPRRRHPRRLVRGIAQPGGSRAVARLGIDALGRDRARRRARGRRLRCADGRRSRPRCEHR